jgi:hypothetical protein
MVNEVCMGKISTDVCPFCESVLNGDVYCDHVIAIYDKSYKEFVFLIEDKLVNEESEGDDYEMDLIDTLILKYQHRFVNNEGAPGFSSQEVFFFSES